MDAASLFDTIDDTVAASNTAPLAVLLASVAMVAGVPVVEVSAGQPPALPDDTLSWSRVDELGNRVRTLAGHPFSRVARDLGDGTLVTCAAFDDRARVLVAAPEPGTWLLLGALSDGRDVSAWRADVAAERGDGPALLADLAALAAAVTA